MIMIMVMIMILIMIVIMTMMVIMMVMMIMMMMMMMTMMGSTRRCFFQVSRGLSSSQAGLDATPGSSQFFCFAPVAPAGLRGVWSWLVQGCAGRSHGWDCATAPIVLPTV